MSDAYVGEIRMAAFPTPPTNWMLCNGQVLPISQYQALFSVIGTTYGGDGQTNFALPDMRGRLPLHRSSTIAVGQTGGEETHTLVTAEIPAHVHAAQANGGKADQASPVNGFWAVPFCSHPLPGPNDAYGPANNIVPLAAGAVSIPSGSGQPHENRSPFQVVNLIICVVGIFPSQN